MRLFPSQSHTRAGFHVQPPTQLPTIAQLYERLQRKKRRSETLLTFGTIALGVIAWMLFIIGWATPVGA